MLLPIERGAREREAERRAFPRNCAVDDARRRKRIHERETAGNFSREREGGRAHEQHLLSDDKWDFGASGLTMRKGRTDRCLRLAREAFVGAESATNAEALLISFKRLHTEHGID